MDFELFAFSSLRHGDEELPGAPIGGADVIISIPFRDSMTGRRHPDSIPRFHDHFSRSDAHCPTRTVLKLCEGYRQRDVA
ncbi:hypothetical protein Y032_0010g1108 [Ancylostoma ceylanicum]|uniref:Uncharacterized protein n=1 Tax=Ancylostoma ceylanicum TaxID=53326 RepID=A0A016VG06_9BILA|nr:hypothetical protein Y032_0010g1108 [Ancylostoma ceylanicum]